MKKLLKLISLFVFVSVSSSVYAGWTFENGTFHITGDTTIFVLPEDSSLYLHKFGYFLNDSKTFNVIDKNNINKALEFKDGDTIRFAKKGILYYYAEETGTSGVYNINSDDYGFTMPFTFTVGTNPISPSGSPLPPVAFTALFGLLSFSGGYLFISKRRRKA